jgi:hypothetical protein
VSRWRAKCLPMGTNSLSFANSEFAFANNLQLKSSVAPQTPLSGKKRVPFLA